MPCGSAPGRSASPRTPPVLPRATPRRLHRPNPSPSRTPTTKSWSPHASCPKPCPRPPVRSQSMCRATRARLDRATRRAGDVARVIEGGDTVSNGGLGRERPFIRGLADSPFNGFSQSTASVRIDEGRVAYWRGPIPASTLADIDRVEILKGRRAALRHRRAGRRRSHRHQPAGDRLHFG